MASFTDSTRLDPSCWSLLGDGNARNSLPEIWTQTSCGQPGLRGGAISRKCVCACACTCSVVVQVCVCIYIYIYKNLSQYMCAHCRMYYQCCFVSCDCNWYCGSVCCFDCTYSLPPSLSTRGITASCTTAGTSHFLPLPLLVLLSGSMLFLHFI